MTAAGWLERWDRQQEVHIRDRERRYDVMLAFLEELAPAAMRTATPSCRRPRCTGCGRSS